MSEEEKPETCFPPSEARQDRVGLRGGSHADYQINSAKAYAPPCRTLRRVARLCGQKIRVERVGRSSSPLPLKLALSSA
jgi:hypothetical protein